MQFSQDLFISYAHNDNQPLSPDQQGWITRFHAALETILTMRMGPKARIWRDDKLRGNDVFSDEIVDQFKQTAVLVTVLTPRYLESEWCTKEIAEFCKSAEEQGGIIVDNKARIFKVIKAPLDAQRALPEILKDLLGYEFFVFEDDAPLELDPAYGQEYAQSFNRKVAKLAWDIRLLLEKLGDDQHLANADIPATSRTMIYLAECGYDLKEMREALECELRRLGYSIFPDQELPRDEERYVADVERLLERCSLAIHLVGESEGIVPDGPSRKSAVVLQNEIAVRKCRSSGLARVIWVPEGTQSEYPRQQEFIDALHHDPEAQFGADLITGSIEELKSSIHSTLLRLEAPKEKQPPEQAGAAGRSRLIYLICDQQDRKSTVPIRKFCKEKGFEVALPAFEGDATAVRQANEKLLTSCDAVIVFYGAGDEAWKRATDAEVTKILGSRSGKPLLAKYTYLADPQTGDKEDLVDMEEPDLIIGSGGFSEIAMAPFIEAMERSD